jgi:glycosyltransferase involved in cell wall biosynthesis
MRILFWSENYQPLIGGVEVFARNLAIGLVHRGHECHIITNLLDPSHPVTEPDHGTTIHRIPILDAIHRNDLKALVQARRTIQEIRTRFQPDVEHVHFNGPIFRIQQMPSPAVAPQLVATLHLLFEQVSGSPAVRQTLKSSGARLVALSKGGFEFLRTHAPDLAPQLHCIGNSVPPPTLAPAPLPWNPPSFLARGRLVHDKGFDIALRAFARVISHATAPRLTLTSDGPERANLEALSAELGLHDRVRFTGWTPAEEVPQLLNEATIALVPSRLKEPFGLVALEAAQMGRPVIASRTGGLPDIVTDSVTGRLVTPEDPVALADAMVDLLSDLPRLQQMGQTARAQALARFDFEHFIDQHLTLYAS